MPTVSGKAFEERFKKDWIKSFPEGTIDRLPDQMSGYREVSKNVSDFIGYNYPLHFYLECKVHKGASIPLTNITQYDKMLQKVGIKGVRAGIILFLNEKDKIFYIPISTIKKMKEDGKKSVGLKSLEEGYNIIEIPSRKLRVFLESDYSILASLKEEE